MVGIKSQKRFLKRKKALLCLSPTSWICHLPKAAQLNNKILVFSQKWCFSQYPLGNWLVQERNQLLIGGGQESELRAASSWFWTIFKMGYSKGEIFFHLREHFRKPDWSPRTWIQRQLNRKAAAKFAKGKWPRKSSEGSFPLRSNPLTITFEKQLPMSPGKSQTSTLWNETELLEWFVQGRASSICFIDRDVHLPRLTCDTTSTRS